MADVHLKALIIRLFAYCLNCQITYYNVCARFFLLLLLALPHCHCSVAWADYTSATLCRREEECAVAKFSGCFCIIVEMNTDARCCRRWWWCFYNESKWAQTHTQKFHREDSWQNRENRKYIHCLFLVSFALSPAHVSFLHL